MGVWRKKAIPPSRLRRATSLYTREALVVCVGMRVWNDRGVHAVILSDSEESQGEEQDDVGITRDGERILAGGFFGLRPQNDR